MAKVTKSGEILRPADEEAGTPFGARLRALRLSLQTNHKRGKPVPAAAMDRVLGSPNTRHIWQRLEQTGDASNPAQMQMVLLAIHNLVNMLEVEQPKRVEQQLVAFVRSERDTLPWKTAPAWRDFQPWKPVGRPRGSRAITTQKFISPGQDLPEGYDVRAALVAPPLAAEQANPAVVAILKAVQAGEMPLDAAVTVLRTLLTGSPICRRLNSR